MPADDPSHWRTISRRRILSATGASVVAGVAGCLGGDGDGPGDSSSDGDSDDSSTPSQTDDDDGGGGYGYGDDEYPIDAAVTDDEIHILTDYSADQWQDMWDEVIVPDFDEEFGIPAEIEYAGFQGTGEQRLTTLAQAGRPPASFTGTADETGDFLVDGQLVPVNETVSYLEEQLGEMTVEPDMTDGKIYEIPHGTYSATIVYRQDILDALSLDPPDTTDQLLENARAIDEDGDIEARGIAVSGVRAGQSASQFLVFLWSNGADYYRVEDDEIQVWFPEEESLEVLEYLIQLSEYSVDPSSVNWGPTLEMWAANRIAQVYQLNAWPVGVAAQVGVDPIVDGSDIAPIPTTPGVDPLARTFIVHDSHPIFRESANPGGAILFFRKMYSDPDRAARYYSDIEPTRFLPAYSDIFETESYQNSELFQAYPKTLELNLKVREEVTPHAPDEQDVPRNAATTYEGRFFHIEEMVNDVLVVERPPREAYREARDTLEERFEEGTRRMEANLF